MVRRLHNGTSKKLRAMLYRSLHRSHFPLTAALCHWLLKQVKGRLRSLGREELVGLKIQQTPTEALPSGHAHTQSCLSHFDVATHTQVVQVDWLKGADGVTQVVGGSRTLEIKGVRLNKKLDEPLSIKSTIRASASQLHFNIRWQVGVKK